MGLLVVTKDNDQIEIPGFEKLVFNDGTSTSEIKAEELEKFIKYAGQYTFVGKRILSIESEEIKYFIFNKD